MAVKRYINSFVVVRVGRTLPYQSKVIPESPRRSATE
jgi:hypothetical protein